MSLFQVCAASAAALVVALLMACFPVYATGARLAGSTWRDALVLSHIRHGQPFFVPRGPRSAS
jgi:hypothetical protein